jgi:excisionase family DNA binding protein
MTGQGIQVDNAAVAAATEGENDEEHRFLTVHEVARLLQVPTSWVYGRLRKRSTQQLPAYRVGKYWRFSEHEIVAWVKKPAERSVCCLTSTLHS